jgi:hypothetical protein
MRFTPEQCALLRTLSWYEVLEFAPSRAELLLTADCDMAPLEKRHVRDALKELLASSVIVEHRGRISFPESVHPLEQRMSTCDAFQPRKRRRARRVARWLSMLPGVRFIALANTTALGHARDEGDLDFFIIVRAGSIWTMRLLGGLPFRVLRMTPRPGCERDAVCLSYFIADDALDLSSHQLVGDDPYFRSWFLSLLPLYDDGVSQAFWEANASIRARFPFAGRWIIPPDLSVGTARARTTTSKTVGSIFSFIESISRCLQQRWFPPSIRERMNRDTTVIVNDRVLKFHTNDGRMMYREKYEELCRKRGIAL